MASTSDGMNPEELGPGIDFSSMRQPPLIKQLKGILSEYPDGGQILKELLQNAEDADATEVKILYDGRRINTEKGPTVSKYRKFFKGPALCVYNNAMFTEKDWEGIRMIYSSVKEDDPLKVGRFGLGFKSVFHITDFPCVLSGDRLLMIDPQEMPDKVNAMIKVSRMDNLQEEDFESSDLWKAFEGMFGLQKDNLSSAGKFEGTVFWFPLREEPSKLSETLYNETKVLDLFDSLSSEASNILLFLKNLERISVFVRASANDPLCVYAAKGIIYERRGDISDSTDTKMMKVLTVKIDDRDGKVKQSRTRFKEKIKSLTTNYSGDDIGNEYVVNIKTTVRKETTETIKWLVANYFVGKSASPEFRRLIEDENIVYSPYVGVAAPIGNTASFEGHVFCFLPLPKEGSKLTGLPVHVNGFFALSQNRHHLKSETEEQKGKKIDDKSILWNKRLIQEAVPKAYGRLVSKFIEISKSEENSEESVAAVYGCLPNTESTNKNWKVVEDELFKKLKKQKFLYCRPKDSWVTVAEACFATFHNLPIDYEKVKGAVIECLNRMGKSQVSVHEALLKTITGYFKSAMVLSPEILAKLIRQQAAFKSMTDEDKLMLLGYLFSDGRFYEKVVELELLPLASGKWINFKKKGDTVFLCSDEEVKVLRCMENKLCRKSMLSQKELVRHIQHICQKDIFQIKELTSLQLASLLRETIEVHLGQDPQITTSSELSFDWLQDVWRYITGNKSIVHLKNTKIVPVLQKGTWNAPEAARLVTFSELLLVKSYQEKTFPDSVCRCFEALGVTVLDALPDWIPRKAVKHDMFWPSQKSIAGLLERIGSQNNAKEVITKFNNSCQSADKPAFLSCLAKCTGIAESQTVRNVLRALEIFPSAKRITEPCTHVSISQVSTYTLVSEDFPDNVLLPFPCLIAEGSEGVFLSQLGAKEIKSKELLLQTLMEHEKRGFENTEEFPKLMEFFIQRFHVYEKEEQIIRYAAKVPFLRTGKKRRRPSELFDPSDRMLCDLLHGEDLLPETKKKLNSEQIKILKLLGLKSVDNINENILVDVAVSLDKWSRAGGENIEMESKAVALLNVLSTKALLLEEKCRNGYTLKDCLKSLACVPVMKRRPQHYPDSLRWLSHDRVLCKPDEAKEQSLSLFVGAVLPVVECRSEAVNKIFGWKNNPAVKIVLDQLKILSECFSIQQRPEFMRPIKLIYEHLEHSIKEVWQMKEYTKDAKIVWNGSFFTEANKVVVRRSQTDLNLCPYFYTVPDDFLSFDKLYTAFGCHPHQDISILLETLRQIQSAHGTNVTNEHELKRDKQMVCDILESISKQKLRQQIWVDENELLVMVHDRLHPNALKLVPLCQCTYDDDPTCYYEVEGDLNLVHNMIPLDVVETLGVRSISKQALHGAEDFGVEWGLSERLTTRIKTLLEQGYTDGLSVPKELIQNADDAGAVTVKFLYDERQNVGYRTRVFSKGLKQFQGPALWVYNNETFTAEDLKNITKINAATKKLDEKKIGKFGLGFCSVYNVTDLPSFVSGDSIVFFDPHEKNLGSDSQSRGTGLKYQFPNRTLVARYCDQFLPYQEVFGCNILDDDFQDFEGTIFRLPLRTEQQAKESQISSLAYSKEEMTTLLKMLINTAGNLLLFTQNVQQIEVHHLAETAASALESRLIYKVSKGTTILDEVHGFASDMGFHQTVQCVLSRAADSLNKSKKDFAELHKTVIRQEMYVDYNDISTSLVEAKRSETTWIISWAIGSRRSLKIYQEKKADGAIPLAAVALPFTGEPLRPLSLKQLPSGFYIDGHSFCFLPLPIKTKLPVHVNACFALTPDRKQLKFATEDDKQSEMFNWNSSVLEDAVVEAYMNLLHSVKSSTFTVSSSRKYFALWPLECAGFATPLKKAFFENVIRMNLRLFPGSSSWFKFQEVEFLKPSFRTSDIGNDAFEMLSRFPREGKTVIDMPKDVLQNLKQHNKSITDLITQAEITEKDFYTRFLDTLSTSYWNERTEQRNALILKAIFCDNKEVTTKMRQIKCIPTEPNNNLAKTSDLVHPTSKIARLFSEKDERFPYKVFKDDEVLNRLVVLGMNKTLIPTRILIDCCDSVPVLANNCFGCAKDRLRAVLEYLSEDFEGNGEIFSGIRDRYILPVLTKPTDWCFRWYANEPSVDIFINKTDSNCSNHPECHETLVLGKSSHMFRYNTKELIGMTALIVDERNLFEGVLDKDRFFQSIGVRETKNIPIEFLASQVYALVNEYTDEKQFEEVARIHRRLFSQMNKVICSQDSLSYLDNLQTAPCILIGTKLVRPDQVAVTVKEECRPYLYRLPELERMLNKNIYYKLGVNDFFDIETILKVMDIVKQKERAADIDTVCNLLINLSDILDRTHKNYEEIAEYHERIVAPDVSGELFPTYKLVTENEDFRTTISMKVLHPAIPHLLGQKLGVKIKQIRCFEEIRIGISFGQREKLVTRIKGLLKAYPCDFSIMKELLQNADDAGATEINFIKDYRFHSKENLFKHSCETLQGPALCVYNDSYFTEKDIEGIHNLGQGSKSDDPTKTGQYGVGFNAVYHLTDTPSFISKGPAIDAEGLLFIFDPMCKHVPEATIAEPGLMCKVKDVQENFPTQLLGFSMEELLPGNTGTLFRFPLRLKPSEISDEVLDKDKVDEILRAFEKDMLEAVLFLKNVRKVTISNISTGDLVPEYTVEVSIGPADTRKLKSFHENTLDIAKRNENEKFKNLEEEPREVIYPLTVVDSRKVLQHWLIVQQFGLVDGYEELLALTKSFRAGDLGLLPLGGVALPLNTQMNLCMKPLFSNDSGDVSATGVALVVTEGKLGFRKEDFAGKAFCFLPLPVNTGLPVHVNGHFALDHESRRNLWNDGYRNQWNLCLVQFNIIPSWILGLLYLIKNCTPHLQASKTWHNVNVILEEFHAMLPVPSQTTSDFWKQMACSFYRFVVQREVAIFPYVLNRKDSHFSLDQEHETDGCKFVVEWTVVKTDSTKIKSGIFNILRSVLPEWYAITRRDTESRALGSLLKSFRLKILETPLYVKRSMEEAKIKDIPSSTPCLVLDFLRGQKFDDHAAGQIEEMQISDSKFRKLEYLYIFIQFLMLDAEFHTKIDGLPILLTADEIVRLCLRRQPVFVSKFWSLLPNSKEIFMHPQIEPLFESSKALQTEYFRIFLFEDLLRLLPTSLDPSVYACGDEVQISGANKGNVLEKALSDDWLATLYAFLVDNALEEPTVTMQKSIPYTPRLQQNAREIDMKKFEKMLDALGIWSFFPCLKSTGQHILVPVSQKQYLLFLSYSMKGENFGKSLEKLCLPTVSTLLFKNPRERKDIESAMRKVVATPDKPFELLNCLVHHKAKIRSTPINADDAIELLGFFNRKLDSLKQAGKKEVIVCLLRQLPLFVTQQGSLTSIDDNREVIVLPKGMPVGGVQTWADACNTTLLQQKETLESLFQFLDLHNADEEYVYGSKILSTFSAMPVEHQIEHITYIKDKLYDKSVLSVKQQKIMQALRNIPFIRIQGRKTTASELYSYEHEVFKVMKSESDFLPPEYRTTEWQKFLEKLGLITVVSDEMMIQFVREVESCGNKHIGDSIRMKSRTLLAHFCKHHGKKWQDSTLLAIRRIKFIEPFVIEENERLLCRRSNDGKKFVCFQDSVPSNNKNLCWTTVDLIEQDLCTRINETVRKKLHLLDRPALDKVVLHCQNVCMSVKNKLIQRDVNEIFVKQLMTEIYDYFDNCPRQELSFVKQDLQKKPFVYLPEENEIVTLEQVVLDLSSDLQIKPYVYRASSYFGKYFDLFQHLGSRRKTMFCHFAHILHSIRESAQDKVLSPPERMFVKKAFAGLLRLDVASDESVRDVNILYLPTKSMVLKNAKEVVVSNSLLLEIRLNSKQIAFCADNLFLKMKSPLVEEVVTKWPERFRPMLLTDLVQEVVSYGTGTGNQVHGSTKASKIQTFFHSDELCIGLCRILKHQNSFDENSGDFDADQHERDIALKLHNINVIELSSLTTVLKYNGEVVASSKMDIYFHVEKVRDLLSQPCRFYFKDSGQTENVDIPRILHGISSVITTSVIQSDNFTSTLVASIIHALENPNEIPQILDRLRIKPYYSSSSHQKEYFPKPGTYVESHFIPFLEQSIEPFKDYEFDQVALELEDASAEQNSTDDRSPVFIYVKILRQVVTLKGSDHNSQAGLLEYKYVVATGNRNIPTEEVPIYRLYRFIRRDIPDTMEIAVVEGAPVFENKPFDEQCRLIREQLRAAWRLPEKERKAIIKRILLQWHPDKNHGNEAYCTKVFQYIRVACSRLENNESLVHDAEAEMSRGPSEFSRESSAFYEFVFRRGKTYARAFHDNFDSYSRSERTGRYAHMNTERPLEHRDFDEAERWLRQAKFDYQTAHNMRRSADNSNSYNWICFVSYQACETALRAACYARDANQIPGEVDLSSLGTSPSMAEQARLLTRRIGNPARTRFPDRTSRPNVPSEIFTEEDADFSIEKARNIIELVEEFIQSR